MSETFNILLSQSITENIPTCDIYTISYTDENVDCVVSEWTPKECPKCSNIPRTRRRNITTHPECHGAACPHLSEVCDIEACKPGKCRHA